MPETKDIALAVFGGAVGLASVLVVFIGFLIAYAQALPAQVSDKVQRRYMRAAQWGLVPTGAAVLEALACYGWFFTRNQCFFYVWSVGFVVVAIGFMFYALIVITLLSR
jgi:hypothetical protein